VSGSEVKASSCLNSQMRDGVSSNLLLHASMIFEKVWSWELWYIVEKVGILIHVLPFLIVRFYFTDQTRVSSTTGGENSVVQMLGSLYESIENDYGAFPTRLYRAFRPKSGNFVKELMVNIVCVVSVNVVIVTCCLWCWCSCYRCWCLYHFDYTLGSCNELNMCWTWTE